MAIALAMGSGTPCQRSPQRSALTDLRHWPPQVVSLNLVKLPAWPQAGGHRTGGQGTSDVQIPMSPGSVCQVGSPTLVRLHALSLRRHIRAPTSATTLSRPPPRRCRGEDQSIGVTRVPQPRREGTMGAALRLSCLRAGGENATHGHSILRKPPLFDSRMRPLAVNRLCRRAPRPGFISQIRANASGESKDTPDTRGAPGTGVSDPTSSVEVGAGQPAPPRTPGEVKDRGDVPSSTFTKGSEVTSSAKPGAPVKPSPRDALNWFCIAIILLVALTDFTPLGTALLAPASPSSPTPALSASAPWILALVQWLFFVGPTVSWAKDCNFSLQDTFKLKACSGKDLAASAAAGVGCWALVGYLLLIKNGSAPDSPATIAAAAQGIASTGSLWDLLWYAASPALAEELLFRGFVLSALSSGLGRIDSVMLAAGMFGAFHLSVSQLFPSMVLGIAAGFATMATGSVFPAVALHFANNAAVVLFGGL